MSAQVSTMAQVPFDRKDADVIIRSSDNVDFHVFKAVLILASPFFADMFSLKQPEPTGSLTDVGTIAARDPIPISEDSKTFDCLMRLCYPIDDPLLDRDCDLPLVEKVLEAAQKYLMDEAAKLARVELGKLAIRFPLNVYAISCRLNAENEARIAAEQWRTEALNAKINAGWLFESTLAGRSFGGKMSTITAGAYYRLLYFLRSPEAPAVRSGMTRFVNGGDPTIQMFGNATMLALPKQTGLCLHDTAQADASLVSSDGVKFPVHSAVLQVASAGGLLKSRSADGTTTQSPVRVDLPSYVLSELLRLCYPLQRLHATSLSLLHDVYAAAQRWNMPKIVSLIRAEFKELVTRHPNTVSVYFVAVAQGWQEEAQEAARIIARQGIQYKYAPEMETADATTYCNLLRFCFDFSLALRTSLRLSGIYTKDDLPQATTPPPSGALDLVIAAQDLTEMDLLSPNKCTHFGPCKQGCPVHDHRVMKTILDQSKRWDEEINLALSKVTPKF